MHSFFFSKYFTFMKFDMKFLFIYFFINKNRKWLNIFISIMILWLKKHLPNTFGYRWLIILKFVYLNLNEFSYYEFIFHFCLLNCKQIKQTTQQHKYVTKNMTFFLIIVKRHFNSLKCIQHLQSLFLIFFVIISFLKSLNILLNRIT